jgi:hypothetical protein
MEVRGFCRGVHSNPSGASAICRVCGHKIQVGEEVVILETYAAGKWLKLFFHPECHEIKEPG